MLIRELLLEKKKNALHFSAIIIRTCNYLSITLWSWIISACQNVVKGSEERTVFDWRWRVWWLILWGTQSWQNSECLSETCRNDCPWNMCSTSVGKNTATSLWTIRTAREKSVSLHVVYLSLNPPASASVFPSENSLFVGFCLWHQTTSCVLCFIWGLQSSSFQFCKKNKK